MEGLKRLARAHSCAFALSAGTGLQAGSQEELAVLVTEEGIHSFVDKGDAFPFKLLFYGPAAIAMVPLEAVTHPELTLVLSKLGCDLALVSTENLSPGDIRLLSMRTLDSLALAAAGTGDSSPI